MFTLQYSTNYTAAHYSKILLAVSMTIYITVHHIKVHLYIEFTKTKKKCVGQLVFILKNKYSDLSKTFTTLKSSKSFSLIQLNSILLYHGAVINEKVTQR